MSTKRVCEHVAALRSDMRARGITIWSEHGECPQGWVNVHCEACHRTFEVTMRPTYGTVDEYATE